MADVVPYNSTLIEILFQKLEEGFALCDRDHVILKINPGFTALFGHTPEEAVGKRLDLLIATTPEMMASSDAQAERIKTWETVLSEAVFRTRKDGSLLKVSIVGNVYHLADGEVLYCWNYLGLQG